MWRSLFAGFCSVGLLVACTGGEQSVRATGLVYCSEGSPDSFNPQISTSGTAYDASAHPLYNRLVDLDPDTGTPQPALAESWTVSRDGTRWKFKLRRDVQFHRTAWFTPTRPFNADDVLFSFERQWRPRHPFHRVSGGNYAYFANIGLGELLTGIVKRGEHEVEFQLREANGSFLTMLSMEFASILSAEYAAQVMQTGQPQQLDQLPVGTGPFQLVRYDQGAFIRYEAHPDYFGGMAKVKRLVFAITPDASLRLSRLRAGECDVMAQPSPAHLPLIRQNSKLKLYSQPSLNISYWAFNTRRPPLNDARVRQALNYAVNRATILDAVYFGAAEQAKSPVPPLVPGHDHLLQDFRHDPDRARELLREAGYGNGFTLDIWAMPVSRPYNPNAKKMAELIQDDLRQIGVNARIVSFEWRDFLRRLRLGEHDSVLLGWSGDLNDADNFLTPLLSCDAIRAGSNRALWCNNEFDALLNEARGSRDLAMREQHYRAAQELFKAEAPWLTIAHSTQFLVARQSIQGLRQSASGGVYFQHAERRP